MGLTQDSLVERLADLGSTANKFLENIQLIFVGTSMKSRLSIALVVQEPWKK